jgi:hypothetical protein
MKEVIDIVKDGNVLNIPHTVEDVRRFYDFYGAHVTQFKATGLGLTLFKYDIHAINLMHYMNIILKQCQTDIPIYIYIYIYILYNGA